MERARFSSTASAWNPARRSRQVARVAQRASRRKLVFRWTHEANDTQPLCSRVQRMVSNKPTNLMAPSGTSRASWSRARVFFATRECAQLRQRPPEYFFPRVLCGAAVKINMSPKHLVRDIFSRQAPPREQAGKSHGRECPTAKAKQVNFVARAVT